MRRLSPKQRMWKEIAEAFETAPDKRNMRQGRLTAHGLCHAVYEYAGTQKVFYALRGAGWLTDYWYLRPAPRPRMADTLRAGLAALFAAMTDAERKATFGYAI